MTDRLSHSGPDPWVQLEVYRQRYDIEGDLTPVHSLERSISRRRARAHALRRRLAYLNKQVDEAESQLSAVEHEVAGARKAGGLLLTEILDRIRVREGETWSPIPVLGYRAWRIVDERVFGAKVPWDGPTMGAKCLNHVPGDDVPHTYARCGPPACGIYATKDLNVLKRKLGLPVFGPVVGVVALTGKVVEHEHGYRAARATAVALAGDFGGKRFAIDDIDRIGDLFDSPLRTIEMACVSACPKPYDYLTKWKEDNSLWTWEQK